MNREEAANILWWASKRHYPGDQMDITAEDIEAFDMAIPALRQPGWVKTADRVPTWEDAPHGYVANAWSYDENPHREDFTIIGVHIRQIEKTDNPNDFWFALPPLPETVGSEPAKVPE